MMDSEPRGPIGYGCGETQSEPALAPPDPGQGGSCDPETRPFFNPPAGRGLPARPSQRLDTLDREVEIVKMTSMRRIAEELNRKDAESGKDVQKESHTVLKAVEIQSRLQALRSREDAEFGAAFTDIWQALLSLPETGALLRHGSVRARLIAALKQRLGGGGE